MLAGFAGLTLPLMPVQAALKRFAPSVARTFPYWYHRKVCRILGVRIHLHGQVERDSAVLLVANHTSWLDIPVLSAVAPLSFVAKQEVSGWPLIGMLARLQNTVFVDRTRRTSVTGTAGTISERLGRGDTIVLFAEGTSTDGNRVLPFRSSLFAAVLPTQKKTNSLLPDDSRELEAKDQPDGSASPQPVVQTVAFAYTNVQGIPIGRADRAHIGWYGDMSIGPHAWQLLKSGPLDVVVEVGPPVPLAAFNDRKHLARATEADLRTRLVRIVRTGKPSSQDNRLES